MESKNKITISVIVSVVLILVVVGIAITANLSSNSGDEFDSSIDSTYDVSTTESTTDETTTEATTKPQLSSNYKILATGVEDNGDVYELVGEQNETVNNGGIKIGVIKNNEWLVEMTSDIPFINDNGYLLLKDTYSGDENFNLENEYHNAGAFFEYCGKGVFIDYYFYATPTTYEHYYTYGIAYNSENGKSHIINCAVTCPLGLKYCTEDDSTLKYWNDDFKIRERLVYKEDDCTSQFCDSKLTILNFDTMETKQMEDIKNFSQYSDGLIYVEKNSYEKFCGFINDNLDVVIDMTEYNLSLAARNDWRAWKEKFNNYYIFNDGKCEFITHAKSGSAFKVTIDKTGKEISSVQVK